MMQDDGRALNQFGDICAILKQDVKLLKAALDADIDSIREIDGLLNSDPRLGSLGKEP